MYQGQLCKIQAHENQDSAFSEMLGKDGGWFLKLKGENGKTKFHLVDQSLGKEMTIDPSMVDESLKNADTSKPFYVVCVVPTNIQPLALNVSPQMDTLVLKACIDSKLHIIEEMRNGTLKDLKVAQEKVKRHEERVKELDEQADELLKILAMPNSYFMYAYGKHSANGQEFCWRIPHKLYGTVFAGSTAIAETQFGPEPVVITRVEKGSYLLNHKLIIAVS